MRILITGSSGFIGKAMMQAVARSVNEAAPVPRDVLYDSAKLKAAMTGADAVVHLAALAHRSGRDEPTAEEFDAVNHRLPLNVYETARKAGVRRFLHISTMNVVVGNPGVLGADSPIAPTSPYGAAKAEAEADLRKLADAGGPELVIVRPPLIYGPDGRGNMASLVKLCALPVPLPFASTKNARSYAGVSNLCDAILFLAEYPGTLPPPAIFHVTDGHDLSLRELVAGMRKGLGRSPGMFPFPPTILDAALRAAGKSLLARRLFGSLHIDDTPLRKLGWTAPYPPEFDLAAMAAYYTKQRG